MQRALSQPLTLVYQYRPRLGIDFVYGVGAVFAAAAAIGIVRVRRALDHRVSFLASLASGSLRIYTELTYIR